MNTILNLLTQFYFFKTWSMMDLKTKYGSNIMKQKLILKTKQKTQKKLNKMEIV